MKTMVGPALPKLAFELLNLCVVDIECADLNSHDMVFCCGIKPLGKAPYVISLRDVPKSKDSYRIDANLLAEIKRHLEHYEGWIGWNSGSFDRPMLDDRLIMAGLEPLEDRLHVDLMKEFKWPKTRTKGISLDWCARQFGCPYQKTPLDIEGWMRARNEVVADALKGKSLWDLAGKDSFSKVIEHNVADLRVTEWMFGKFKPRIRKISKR